MRKKIDLKKEISKASVNLKQATLEDTASVLGVMIFTIAGSLVVLSLCIFIGSFIPVDDYIKLGRYVSFHYIFLSILGILLIKYSKLGSQKQNNKAKSLSFFLNRSTYSIGMILLILSLIIILFHACLSLMASLYTIEYVIELMGYA